MFKGRIWPIIAIAIGLVLLFLLCRASPWFKSTGQESTTLPVDLQNVIPSSWTPLPNQPSSCDYDGDGEQEWLVLFRYDSTQVQVPYQQQGTTVQRGPIGGVIYDAQVNYVPQEPGNRSPYRPALIIPYMLLPDFYPGKGQGYLGESNVTLAQYPPPGKQGTTCAITEIYVFGYSDGSLPTRLTAFRWRGKATGYAAVAFAGDARIAADLSPNSTKPLEEVMTYNRLDNHRSLLCEVKRFTRGGEQADLTFTEDLDSYTIDFCFNAPDDPYYPEGVVVALLRGKAPVSAQNMPPPMNDTYLMAGVTLPPALGDPETTPVRILSVVNQGAVETLPDQGRPCPNQSLEASAGSAEPSEKIIWWCGSEQAQVLTEVFLSGQTRRVLWKLTSVANDQVNTETYWRVSEVELF